jgi:hypothetical protein
VERVGIYEMRVARRCLSGKRSRYHKKAGVSICFMGHRRSGPSYPIGAKTGVIIGG